MKRIRLVVALITLALAGIVTLSPAQTTPTSITLTWTTPGDDSLSGTASQYDLRYSTTTITAANFAAATRWTSMPAPAVPLGTQGVTVTGLTPATTYWFALKTADEVPNWSGISNIVSRATLAAGDTLRPAAVTNLAILSTTDSSATLQWTATGDDSLTGTATSYDIRVSTSPITSANWAAATQVTGEPAPAARGTAQSFTVRGLGRQVTYHFALRVSDEAGNVSALSNVPSATTPDTSAPAAVRDLAAGFVWFGWHTAPALRPRGAESAPR